MSAHKNAHLTRYSRELMIARIRKQGWTVARAADAAGVSERTACKLLARYRGGGAAALRKLRNEPKFLPTLGYTGADTPEDARLLIALVNNVIDEISSWSLPIDRNQLRDRLKKLIADVDLFATEDREMAYRYAIRIWRAAGLVEESQLFERSDDFVVALPRRIYMQDDRC